LGTIIRGLDWFGYSKVLCSNRCADFYNPKTIAATMGSFTRVRPYYSDLLEFFSSYNGQIYGIDLEGDPLEKFVPSGNCAFIMGSESHGISRELLELVTGSLTIKRYGNAESLNVAMTANILLYQLRMGQM
jgi:TrmH family RNA methyltransferase